MSANNIDNKSIEMQEQTRKTSLDAQELDPLNLALEGRHLIEASAGTGKTFNITRLYVRLLVEKSYSVQQILVMTFTEAATEEIRSRVAQFIDEVLEKWDSNDPFIAELQRRVDKTQAKALLLSAKLTIDDAAIFTIHGFCQRVITQFSSSMKQDPDSVIVPHIEPLMMQALSDVIIGLDKEGEDFALLQSNTWHTPKQFFNAFKSLLEHQGDIELQSAEKIWHEYVQNANQHWQEAHLERTKMIQHLNNSDNWLDGLAASAKNAKKVELEIQNATAFLQKAHLFESDKAQQLFLELQASGFVGKLNKKILDDSFLLLFSTGRLKKYPEAWAAERKQEYEAAFAKIEAPLNGDKKRLDKLMRLSLAHVAVLKIIEQVKSKVNALMQQDSLHSYDDLIRIVSEALSKGNSDAMTTHLRKQFPVALVDEFQDTDQQQYQIFSSLYEKAAKDTALIMIGDPKQAIYGFRGGDVFTYLQAREAADYLWSMDTNWRSTEEMVAAYNFVFADAPSADAKVDDAKVDAKVYDNEAQVVTDKQSVFDYGIDYLPITPAQGTKKAKSSLLLEGEEQTQALQFVCTDAYVEDEKLTHDSIQRVQMIQWMINEIKYLLVHGVINDEKGSRSVESQDIAVLVRAGFEADLIKLWFQQNGLASVYLSEKSPLFESTQAHHLYYVLDAIWTGNDQRRCITALSTGLFYSPQPSEQYEGLEIAHLIADRSHPAWQQVYKQNAAYRQIWQKQGIYALLMHLIKEQLQLSELVEQAERALTNYQHLAELMAKAAVMHTTPSAQLMWLSKQIQQTDSDETSQLRLESDQALIKIVTQHKSKGLEYPIVFLPFANTVRDEKEAKIIKYHDQDKKLHMQLGANEGAQLAMQRESMAEEMRLLYVALTRPIYRCYLGMMACKGVEKSAIHRALSLPSLLSDSNSPLEASNYEANKNYADVLAGYIQAACENESALGVRKANAHVADIELNELQVHAELTVHKVTRKIEQNWMLTSFTGITRLMHANSADEPSTSRLMREPEFDNQQSTESTEPINAEATLLNAVLSKENAERDDAEESDLLCFNMQKGPDTGNILHDSFEYLSFNSPDFENIFERIAQKHQNFADVDRQKYRDWLCQCLQAPLKIAGQNSPSLCLAQLADTETIKESEFYLPIESLNSRALETTLANHRARIAERFNFEAVSVNALSKHKIAGMLHGFIDLIFCANGQYFISDYKSTHLGNKHSFYTAASLAHNIQQHDYDLQYLLYAMALDRYLTLSLANYRPAEHFGGVYYLYLRGMTDAPEQLIEGVSPGVYFSDITAEELEQLNRIFNGESDTLEAFEEGV